MNPFSVHDRKRRLLVVLAGLVLLQTLLGFPELSSGATGAAAEPHHASVFAQADEARMAVGGADHCQDPSEPTQCDQCCCCLGAHLSVLPEPLVLHDLPISIWLMARTPRSPSRPTTAIHRPPIV